MPKDVVTPADHGQHGEGPWLRWLATLLCLLPIIGLLAQLTQGLVNETGTLPGISLWIGSLGPVVVLWWIWQHRESVIIRPTSDAKVREAVVDRAAVLAAGMAHELGQPLSVARVSIEGLHMLRQLGRDPSPEYLDKVMRDLGHSVLAMSAIVDHLQSLALHQRPAERKPVDLITFIDHLLEERRLWLWHTEIPIVWDPVDPPPNIALVEEAGLRLILVNLIKNAVEAVHRLPTSQRQVQLTSLGNGTLSVRNRGLAIPAERLEVIFDPFVSSKSDGRPRVRGVGLYLARLTAQRMGANLGVYSRPEEGTVFTLAAEAASTP
jgi:signal transduction histidine kinase